MINLKEIITKYPECLESASKLRSYLVDLYPQEKRNINIITTIFECGIAEEIKNAQGEIDDITIHSYCNRLENDYAYSVAFSRECVLLWSDAYKKVVNNDSKGTEKKVSGGLHIEKGVLKDIGTCYCRHVVIPNIVTRIEEKAFKNCDNIISVTIPDSVTSIGDWAFENCKNLCEIKVVDDNLNYCSIDGNLFRKDGKELVQYAIGKTQTTFILPDGVTSIKRGAFAYCRFLVNITIPNSITNIDSFAFYGCRCVKIINGVYYVDKWVIDCDPTINSVTIKSDTCGIASFSFSRCSNLMSVTIPDSVKNIGCCAFDNCPCVKIINGVHYIDRWIIDCDKSVTAVNIKDNIIGIADYAFCGRINLKEINISVGIKYIGNSAFRDCKNVTNIIIPHSVESIGDGSFFGCGLTNMIIPNSVVNIGVCAFSRCSNLANIILPCSIKRIESWLFQHCSTLRNVTIPENVVSIGYDAFRDCCNLTNINLPKSVIYIEDRAFSLCRSLDNLIIPDNLISIGSGAFIGCCSLKNIVIPESVISIGRYAFASCDSLSSITIFNSVKSIGKGALRYCEKLATIYFNGTEQELKTIYEGLNNDILPNCELVYVANQESFSTNRYGQNIEQINDRYFRIAPIFLLIDTSEDLQGEKIDFINCAIKKFLIEIEGWGGSFFDVKLAVATFSDEIYWVSEELQTPEELRKTLGNRNLIAQGKSQMGKALLSLNDKMSRTGYLKNFGNGGYCCPIFIIISGSEPVDDCDKPIIELNKNNLFRYAFQMALCVGNNINKTILRALCKNDEYHWIGNEEEKLGEIVISIKDTESIKSFFHDYMRDFYS